MIFYQSQKTRNSAFTIIELLIVITMIVLLAALGVSAFKGGAASDGTRGASYTAAALFDAARNEAIMRRVPTRVIFDVGNSSTPDTAFRRMTVAYTTNNGTNWTQSGRWLKFPSSAYFDYNPVGLPRQSRGYDTATLYPGFGSSTASACVAYEYLPNGQANYSGGITSPLKVIFSPGIVLGGKFTERPDNKSLYGFVINRLGHTQQFADLNSLTNCP